MAKCIYDCAKCVLDVDKSLCCQFQTLRLLVELKRMFAESSARRAKQKTIADIAVDSNPKTE